MKTTRYAVRRDPLLPNLHQVIDTKVPLKGQPPRVLARFSEFEAATRDADRRNAEERRRR